MGGSNYQNVIIHTRICILVMKNFIKNHIQDVVLSCSMSKHSIIACLKVRRKKETKETIKKLSIWVWMNGLRDAFMTSSKYSTGVGTTF